MQSLKWRFFQSFLKLKKTEMVLFTIYPIVQFKKMLIIHNSFEILSSKRVLQQQKGIYIIGTNTSMLGLDREKYQSTLLQIKKYYNDEITWYCPHRRDNNSYADFCNVNGIKMFDTRVSVEYDFIQRELYPRVIIGYGSTALYTLKLLYPLAEIHNICFDTKDDHIAKNYIYISEFLKKHGILSCSNNYWLK